jgi:hypothetical protein
MDNQNPLDEVTSKEFIFDALMVGLIMSIIGLAVFVLATYFDIGRIVTTPQVEKVPECHVYYHQHNEVHDWKGELK